MKKLAVLFLLASPLAAVANTNLLSDGNFTTVLNAISNLPPISATNPVNLIVMPAGGWTWTNSLAIGRGASFAENPVPGQFNCQVGGIGFELMGQGANSTFITNAYVSTAGYATLDVRSCETNVIRIHDFAIVDLTNGISSTLINISGVTSYTNPNANGNAFNFRVCNMVFTNIQNLAAIQVAGWATGLIDHNQFYTSQNAVGSGAIGVRIQGEGPYGWDVRPLAWGDTNRLFIEYNVFSWTTSWGGQDGAEDSYLSGRWCFRYNSVTNTNVGNHGADSSAADSDHSYEVYGNTFYSAPGYPLRMFGFRGGTGIFFSNTVIETPASDAYIGLSDYRCTGINLYTGGTNSAWPSGVGCCLPWGPMCATNPWDGCQDQYGWPGFEQQGTTGPIQFFTNVTAALYPVFTALNYLNLTNAPVPWGGQLFTNSLVISTIQSTNSLTAPNGSNVFGFTVPVLAPMYSWSNTVNTNLPLNFGVYDGSETYTNSGIYAFIPTADQIIQAGRDYFNNTPKPGYTPLGVHPLSLTPLSAAIVLSPPSNLRVVPP